MATSRNVSGRVVGSQDGSEVASPQGDQLVLAVGTERGASAFALPSQRQIATHALPESSSVVVAKAVEWGKDKCSPLLLSFTSDGKVKALSLPTLRTLTESPLIMNINPASTASTRIFKTISFSAGGAGLFFTNQNQVLLPKPKPKPGTFAKTKTKTRYFCLLCCLHLHQLQVQKFSVNKENTKALYESFGEFFQVPVPFFF